MSALSGSRSGVLVAVLGGPGTGKSTITKALVSEFASTYAAERVYLGSGDGDRSGGRALLRFVRRLKAPRQALPGTASEFPRRSKSRAARAYHVLWAVALAMERQKKLRQITKHLSKGKLVVTDRYPQDQVDGYDDGPLLGWLGGPVARWERRLYASANMPRPNLVIKLVAAPEILQQRRPNLNPALIAKKHAGILQLTFQDSPILIFDAGEPFSLVLDSIKQVIHSACSDDEQADVARDR